MEKAEIRNDDKTEVAPLIDKTVGNGTTFKRLQQN
jgi:hypothetical protein